MCVSKTLWLSISWQRFALSKQIFKLSAFYERFFPPFYLIASPWSCNGRGSEFQGCWGLLWSVFLERRAPRVSSAPSSFSTMPGSAGSPLSVCQDHGELHRLLLSSGVEAAGGHFTWLDLRALWKLLFRLSMPLCSTLGPSQPDAMINPTAPIALLTHPSLFFLLSISPSYQLSINGSRDVWADRVSGRSAVGSLPGAGLAQVFGYWLLRRRGRMGAAFLFSGLASRWWMVPSVEICEGVGGC